MNEDEIKGEIIGFHDEFITSIVLSEDEKFIYSGSYDRKIKKFNLEEKNK